MVIYLCLEIWSIQTTVDILLVDSREYILIQATDCCSFDRETRITFLVYSKFNRCPIPPPCKCTCIAHSANSNIITLFPSDLTMPMFPPSGFSRPSPVLPCPLWAHRRNLSIRRIPGLVYRVLLFAQLGLEMHSGAYK